MGGGYVSSWLRTMIFSGETPSAWVARRIWRSYTNWAGVSFKPLPFYSRADGS
jgi:hypothetical protein